MADESVDPPEPMPRWIPRALVLFFVGVVLVLIGGWLLDRLRGLIIMLLASLFLSFALEPAVNRLAARGWRRGSATWSHLRGAAGHRGRVVLAIGKVVVDEVEHFADQAPDNIEQVVNWINDTLRHRPRQPEPAGGADEGGRPAPPVRHEGGGQRRRGQPQRHRRVLPDPHHRPVHLLPRGRRARGSGERSARSSDPTASGRCWRAWEIAIDKTGGYIYSRALLAAAVGVLPLDRVPSIIGVEYALALAPVRGRHVPVRPRRRHLHRRRAARARGPGRPTRSRRCGCWRFVVVYQQIENYLFAPRITARTMRCTRPSPSARSSSGPRSSGRSARSSRCPSRR